MDKQRKKEIAIGIFLCCMTLVAVVGVGYLVLEKFSIPFKTCEDNNYTGYVELGKEIVSCQELKNITTSEGANGISEFADWLHPLIDFGLVIIAFLFLVIIFRIVWIGIRGSSGSWGEFDPEFIEMDEIINSIIPCAKKRLAEIRKKHPQWRNSEMLGYKHMPKDLKDQMNADNYKKFKKLMKKWKKM